MSVCLLSETPSGDLLRAVFSPEEGMALKEFCLGSVSLLDPATEKGFTERRAGLGVLSGPHFLRRKKQVQPPVPSTLSLPHQNYLEQRGETDPFAHGICRYMPWRVLSCTQQMLVAELSGKDLYQGVPLEELQGQSFLLRFSVSTKEGKLSIHFSCTSETDSMCGLHYYYHVGPKGGQVEALVAPTLLKEGKPCALPTQWNYQERNVLLPLGSEGFDYTFHGYPNPRQTKVTLKTENYTLTTHIQAPSDETSWQLYAPPKASFVSIEPLSCFNPHAPHLSSSQIEVVLEPSLEIHYGN